MQRSAKSGLETAPLSLSLFLSVFLCLYPFSKCRWCSLCFRANRRGYISTSAFCIKVTGPQERPSIGAGPAAGSRQRGRWRHRQK